MSVDEGPKKRAKLIVVVAFDPDEEGNMQTVFGPQDFPTEDRAVRMAQALADNHQGVLAWSREADIDLGEYGPPTILFQHGDTPDWSVCHRHHFGHIKASSRHLKAAVEPVTLRCAPSCPHV